MSTSEGDVSPACSVSCITGPAAEVMASSSFHNKETKCANQGASCTCDGNVRFGVDSSWSPPVRVHDSIMCAAGKDFKDPAPS